jgi:hypothetical protein
MPYKHVLWAPDAVALVTQPPERLSAWTPLMELGSSTPSTRRRTLRHRLRRRHGRGPRLLRRR